MDIYTLTKLNVMQEAALLDVSVGKTVSNTVTVTAKDKNVNRSAPVSVCKKGCGRLYRDWFDELVCPVCGYHEYSGEESLDNHKHSRLC